MRIALLAVIAAVGGAGICLAIAGMRWVPVGLTLGIARGGEAVRNRVRRGAAATAVGTVAFVITGWPIAVPFAIGAALGLRGLGGRPAKQVIEKLEAIASWTEMVRDTLAGASGLTQALTATASISPRPIRTEVSLLASRLSNGVALTTALRNFGDEIAEPTGDVVVATLLMAATERAQRLGDLLGALAESTRDEVAMLEGVEASRSSARSAVRTVTAFSFGFLALMALLERPYLAPYRSADGQLVLVVVGACFTFGLWLMATMVRPRPAPRLLVGEAPA